MVKANERIVLSTTSTFSTNNKQLVDRLAANGFRLEKNPYGRKLTEGELVGLLDEFQPVGLLAGVEPITEHALKTASPNLRVISRVGVGWDNVDRDAAASHGIKIYRTPGAVTWGVVELTIGLFLDLARHISLHDTTVKAGQWQRFMGVQLKEKTLGIIGCGRVGTAVALAMRKIFNCHAMTYDPGVDEICCLTNKIERVGSLDELFVRSDMISIHCDLTDATFHMVNSKVLSRAKPNLLLVNAARGGIVDENALYEALLTKKIAGAALDVYEEEPYIGELATLSNIVLTPHIGSYAQEVRIQMEEEAVDNLLNYFKVN